ncbi:MAG TPA: ECF-type sigma factor, partial [Vicinamibacterales bacterium]|nr:ECF-type sigma factor [Vicinamibacterales bacterium]
MGTRGGGPTVLPRVLAGRLHGRSERFPLCGDALTDDLAPLFDGWASQDPETRERLIPIVYAELRRLAQHYMKGERQNHTLQPTALVNEMYLRLANIDRMQWRDRAHFVAMAATLMRRVLVDYARASARDKRGGQISVTSLGDD